MQFSNVLMVIAVIAVALAVFNLGAVVLTQQTQTGFASSDPGVANLTVAASISINFTTDRIEWGTGAVDSVRGSSGILRTDGPVNIGVDGFLNVSNGLVLRNDGNVHVNLTLVSNKNAVTFIGGTTVTPRYEWMVSNKQAGACNALASTVLNPTAYTAVTTGAVARNVCSNFTQGANLTMDILVEIPLDSPPELKSSIITAQAYYPSI